MRKLCGLVAAGFVLASALPAAAQEEGAPGVTFSLEVGGRKAAGVAQVNVSAQPENPAASFDPIQVGLVTNIAESDRLLESWWQEGPMAPPRNARVQVETAAYDLEGCKLASRSFSLPGWSTPAQENWSLSCRSLRRR